MRLIIVTALLFSVVAGCSSEPVSLPVDATPTSWELQAKKDADRDEGRRDLKAKKKRDAQAEIERAKSAELRRFADEANAKKRAKEHAELVLEIASLKQACCEHLHQLLSFKDKDDFKFYGWSTGGGYNKWMDSITALRDSMPVGFEHPIPLELRAAPGEVLLLGFNLIFKPDGDSNWWRRLSEVKKTIGYSKYLVEVLKEKPPEVYKVEDVFGN